STRRWHCGHARALKDLAHVKRESPVEPLPNRKAAKDRGIAGSPGDDYFCAGLQGGYVRTGAHLGDDRPAGRDGFFGYGRDPSERLDTPGNQRTLAVGLLL